MPYLRKSEPKIIVVLLLILGVQVTLPSGCEATLLWELGQPNDSAAEFSLAPEGFRSFDRDGFFVVGDSSPEVDWPYIIPGPKDSWAGFKPHTFTLVFNLANPLPTGDSVLKIDLVDTHPSSPAVLKVEVNDLSFERQTLPGGPDRSLRGDVSMAVEQILEFPIPAGVFHTGNNFIRITNAAGTWVVCDWIGLEASETAVLADPEEGVHCAGTEMPAWILESEDRLFQSLEVCLYRVGPSLPVRIGSPETGWREETLAPGIQTFELQIPAATSEIARKVEVVSGTDEVLAAVEWTQPAMREWTVYLMPHSHVDIGYTKVQTEVEADQVRFLSEAIEASNLTRDNTPGSQFKWNSEVLWAVDAFIQAATPAQIKDLVQAVRKNWLELDALYGNELTGLCRSEELVRLLDCACRLRRDLGVKIDTAMISDVPGYTWGLIPVLASSGIKYFSVGPNRGDRIGSTLDAWGDRPFYWVSPCGQEKVLTWVHGQGYSWFHQGPLREGNRVLDYLAQLEDSGYPYDLIGLRYNIGGDNGPPDVELTDFVAEWNDRYAYPKILISTAGEMFREFEKRYGDRLPSFTGDFTPYWEDGAASSARETVLNRNAAERLVQAEALYSMLDPRSYPAEDFLQTWRKVLLYDEHTWGAHNSISQPDEPFVLDQWKIKQAFAVEADAESKQLLDRSLASLGKPGDRVESVLVLNTSSWTRTDLVQLPKEWNLPGQRVVDEDGLPMPSQRLSTGELAFVAREVPPLGGKAFRVEVGEAWSEEVCTAEGNSIRSDSLQLELDPQTGAIASLVDSERQGEWVDRSGFSGLNDYRYVAGKDPSAAQGVGATRISVGEEGPLVASLRVESEAPGCRSLVREVRLVAGLNRVDLCNTLDKTPVREKEGVHFAFPFEVPAGVIRMDGPWSVARPEADQLPGSCKNSVAIERWVDVSNQERGVTWASLDAPMIEIGSITAELPWLQTLPVTQTFLSYVMNNYWHTNYKADQEGLTAFRYSLRPHGLYNSAEAERFGLETSQPLIAFPARSEQTSIPSLLRLEQSGVLVSGVRPAEDAKSLSIRLFGASGRPEQVEIKTGRALGSPLRLTNLAGDRGNLVREAVPVAPYSLVTIQAPVRAQ